MALLPVQCSPGMPAAIAASFGLWRAMTLETRLSEGRKQAEQLYSVGA
jgi:hypothetical protein